MPGAFARFRAGWIQDYAALQQGDRHACLEPLRTALAIGARHRLFGFWGWDPALVQPLLAEALQAGLYPDYCRSLIGIHRLEGLPDGLGAT